MVRNETLGCAFEILSQNRRLLQFEKKPKTSLEFRILTRFVITFEKNNPITKERKFAQFSGSMCEQITINLMQGELQL